MIVWVVDRLLRKKATSSTTDEEYQLVALRKMMIAYEDEVDKISQISDPGERVNRYADLANRKHGG